MQATKRHEYSFIWRRFGRFEWSIIPTFIWNEMPIYEIISGAAIAFAAILMILPGFLTDFLGIIIIFPWTCKLLFKNIKINKKKEKNFIDGEYEEKDDEK